VFLLANFSIHNAVFFIAFIIKSTDFSDEPEISYRGAIDLEFRDNDFIFYCNSKYGLTSDLGKLKSYEVMVTSMVVRSRLFHKKSNNTAQVDKTN
jgi:hypothetical protein